MIVWLTSYPRSGNTLLRILLHRVFGIASTSLYGSATGTTKSPARRFMRAAGAEFLTGEDLPAFLAQARATPAPVLVKTHEAPAADDAAIYVVRDGRAAVVSYFQHFKASSKGTPSLRAVVRGELGFGSWSAHLESWQPQRRARTLLVRFEDIVGRPDAVIAALGCFLERPPLAAWANPIAELQQVDPAFFRGGSNARNIAELPPADEAVFWEMHGAWMARLGYARAPRLRRLWSRLRAVPGAARAGLN